MRLISKRFVSLMVVVAVGWLTEGCAKVAVPSALASTEEATNISEFEQRVLATNGVGTNAKIPQNLVKLNQLLLAPLEKNIALGKRPDRRQNLPSFDQLNKMLGGKLKNAKMLAWPQPVSSIVPPTARSKYDTPTSGNLSSQSQFFVVQICAAAYPLDPSKQQSCVDRITQFLEDNNIVLGGSVFGPVYAYFPVSIQNVGTGSCLYLYVPNLAIGIACIGTDGFNTGGAWAGCDIFSGCGSGTF